MKLTIALALTLLNLTSQSFGRSAPYSAFCVPISAGEPRSQIGSGFILGASNSIYLVTARHVLFESRGTNGWHLKHPLINVSAFYYETQTNEISVQISLNLGVLLPKGEARFSPNKDVALIRFEERRETNRNYVTYLRGVAITSPIKTVNPIPENRLRTGIGPLNVGSDVLLFGFPSAIGIPNIPQIDFDRPLLRKGIIAGLNSSRQTIIIDCPVYQGNSGGPVLMREQATAAGFDFSVIGIAVEWVPFQDTWTNQRFGYSNVNLLNSGYSVVEPTEAILEMLWK